MTRDKARRSRMRLKANVEGPIWPDQQVSEAFGVGVSILHRCASDALRPGWIQHWPANLPSHAHSTVLRKPVSWPSRAASRRRWGLVTIRSPAVYDCEAIQHLVDSRDPQADPIVLLQDHWNTPQLASQYEAFPPAEARWLIDKLEVHDTPSLAVGSTGRQSPGECCRDRASTAAS